MTRARLWHRVVAGIIAAYHLVIGLALLLSGELALKLARLAAGLKIEGSPQMGIVGEIFGCYVLAFGLMMVFVAVDPVKNRSLISAGIALFALRLIQRVAFASKTMTILGLSAADYWPPALVVAVLGAALVAMRWQVARDLRTSTPSGA
jgi:hypothetical protein